MSYSFQPQNAVNASWQPELEYTLKTVSLDVNFGSYSTGLISGKTKANTKVIAFKRGVDGVDFNYRYETTSDELGNFTINVPVDTTTYAVFSISNNTVQNTLVYDWIQPI